MLDRYNSVRDQELILSLVPIPFSRETAPLAVSFIFCVFVLKSKHIIGGYVK